MITDDELLDLIKNELPDSERRGVIESLAGSASLREDLNILLKMEQGINSYMGNISEPEETAANLFGKLGYSPVFTTEVPDSVPHNRLNLNIIISLSTILVVLLSVLFLEDLMDENTQSFNLPARIPIMKSEALLPAITDNNSPEINNISNAANTELKQSLAGAPKKMKLPAEPGNTDRLTESFGKENMEAKDGNKAAIPDNFTENNEITQYLIGRPSENEYSSELPDLRDLADNSIEEATKGLDEGLSNQDFSMELNLNQGYYINSAGIKGAMFNLPENAMLTAYYNFDRHFSAGLAYSTDIFRIGNSEYNPSSFGIALAFTGNETAGFAPAGRIFAGINEPGALLKINTGINYRINKSTQLFFGIGFQDFFILDRNQIMDSKKIGFEIGIKVSF